MQTRSFKNIIKTSIAVATTNDDDAVTGNAAGGIYNGARIDDTAAGGVAPLVAAANRLVAPLNIVRGNQYEFNDHTVIQECLFDGAPANVAGGLAFGFTYDALSIEKTVEIHGITPIALFESVAKVVTDCPSDIRFTGLNDARKLFVWFPAAKAANYIGGANNLKGVRFKLYLKVKE